MDIVDQVNRHLPPPCTPAAPDGPPRSGVDAHRPLERIVRALPPPELGEEREEALPVSSGVFREERTRSRHPSVVDGVEERVLVGEVSVQRGDTHASGVGHCRHGDVRRALRQQPSSRLHDGVLRLARPLLANGTGGLYLEAGEWDDVARCRDFYRDVLGMRVASAEEGESVWFEVGGRTFGFHVGDPVPRETRSAVNLVLNVDAVVTIDDEAERLEALGVNLFMGPTDMPWGARVITFVDPLGHSVWYGQRSDD